MKHANSLFIHAKDLIGDQFGDKKNLKHWVENVLKEPWLSKVWQNYQQEIENFSKGSRKVFHPFMPDFLKEGGKQMRALSVAVCAGLVKEQYFEWIQGAFSFEIKESARKFFAESHLEKHVAQLSVGVEVLHYASLIHDDIVDETRMRRGVQSGWRRYGVKNALMCGDLLLGKILVYLGKIQVPDVMESVFQMLQQLSSGQLEESILCESYQKMIIANALELLPQLRWGYGRICIQKTGALFEYGCEMAVKIIQWTHQNFMDKMSFLYKLDGEKKEKLSEFFQKTNRCARLYGRYLGCVLQLQDDLLDYKPGQPGEDYFSGRLTFPILYLLHMQSLNQYSFCDFEKVWAEKSDKNYAILMELMSGAHFCAKASDYLRGICDKTVGFLKEITSPGYNVYHFSNFSDNSRIIYANFLEFLVDFAYHRKE